MTVNIKVSDEHFITSDSKQLILNRSKVVDPKDGNEPYLKTWPIAFFSSVESLCLRLIDLEIVVSDVNCLKEILYELKNIHATINEIGIEINSQWKRTKK